MNEQAINSDLANGSTDTLPNQDAHRNERIDRLILATLPGVTLSLPALFTVPSWPWAAPVVAALLILTSIGVWLLSFWVYRALIIPDGNGTVPPWWQWWLWQSAKTRRPYIRVAIYIAALLYFMGVFSILIQWWTESRDWDSFSFGLDPMVFGIALYYFFALMWGRSGGPVDRALDRPYGIALIIVLAYLLFAGGLWLVPSQLGKLKVGQAVPWAEQWAVAQKALADKYPDAVLTGIGASHEYDAPATCNARLQLTFDFKEADETDIPVTLADTNPEASIYVSNPIKPTYDANPYTADDLAKLKALYGTLHVGPRAALQQALAALAKDGQTANSCTFLNITLHLADPKRGADKTFDSLKRPSVWEVDLYNRTSGASQTRYWVDAQTGDILLHDHGSTP